MSDSRKPRTAAGQSMASFLDRHDQGDWSRMIADIEAEAAEQVLQPLREREPLYDIGGDRVRLPTGK